MLNMMFPGLFIGRKGRKLTLRWKCKVAMLAGLSLGPFNTLDGRRRKWWWWWWWW
jgi:hypothetical protein